MGVWNWVFEHFVQVRASKFNAVTAQEFRNFRRYVIDGLGKKLGQEDSELHTTGSRKLISRFRSHIYYEQRPMYSDRETYDKRLVARALGVSPSMPIQPSFGWLLRLYAFRMLAPTAVRLEIASMLMRKVRISEGRKQIYPSVVRRLIGHPGNEFFVSDYLSDELDFLIRRFHNFGSQKALFNLERQPIQLIKAAYLMGVRAAKDIPATLGRLAEGENPAAILILVEEGVISAEHPPLVEFSPKGYPVNNLDSVSEREEFRATVRTLKESGASLTDLLWLIGCHHRFDARALAQRLELLRRHGISNIPAVFRQIKAKLWTTELDVLKFALTEMQIAEPTHFGRLGPLFSLYSAPHPSVTQALLSFGATQENLVRCQDLIRECKDVAKDCTRRICLLLSSGLSFADLNKCSLYLRLDTYGTDRFQNFFDTLGNFKLQTREALLAFQPSFTHYEASPSLDLRLSVALAHVPDMPLTVLAQWVEKSSGVRNDSLRYIGLESGISIVSVELLEKALRVCVISVDLLRFLVEECDKRSIAALVDWYYDLGTNASAYSGRGNCDGPTRALFRDCMKRRSFLHLNGNASALAKAWCDYSSNRAGQWDWAWTEQQKEAHRLQRESHYASARDKSESIVVEILDSTDGFLFASTLLFALNGGNYKEGLLSLRPQIEKIVLGQGPGEGSLSQLQIEALSLAYGVHAEDVARLWPRVVGKEAHIAQLAVSTSYDMALVQDSYELGRVSSSYADSISSAIESFALSAALAKGMNAGGIVSLGLRWKHLANPAATPRDLWKWFGLLLGMVENHEQVRPWIERSLDDMRGLLHKGGKAAEKLESFRNFLAVTLSDAIEPAVAQFVHSLSPLEAEFLTQNLMLLRPQGEVAVGVHLEDLIRELHARVVSVYCRWIDTIRKRVLQRSAANEVHATAVLSKFPASFFARFSFGLCTSNNVAMWDGNPPGN